MRICVQTFTLSVILSITSLCLIAQTTAFTYQGFFKDGANNANGNYDFQFLLFSAASGGSQIDSTNFRLNVPVTDGVFSVLLDFNVAGFTGPDRYLEIRVRPSGTTTYTTLTPRSFVGSSPYSVQAVNATNASLLGNVPAANYLQSGSATINAGTQFNIGGNRALSTPATENTFVGMNSGTGNSSSTGNTFVGFGSGQTNSSGGQNTAVGARSGQNLTGFGNAFFGYNAGNATTSQGGNSFFGNGAGDVNTAGDNSFFGNSAGGANTTGIQNSFFGKHAGLLNVTGTENAYFGFESGRNSTASFNSFFGSRAGQANSTGSSNSFFGTAAGVANTTGGDNSFFGVNSGVLNAGGSGNSYFGRRAGRDSTGSNNTAVGIDAGRDNLTGSNSTFIGANADASAPGLSFATAIGAGAVVNFSNRVVIGRSSDTVEIAGDLAGPSIIGAVTISGAVRVAPGATIGDDTEDACFSDSVGGWWTLSYCGSSIKLKENVLDVNFGIGTIKKLRPVTFSWKNTGKPSLGLIAEEVNEVEPLLAHRDKDGSARSVNFNGVTAVLINALKEQQTQIEDQREDIRKLNEAVTLLVAQNAKQTQEIALLKRSRNKSKRK